MGLSEIRVSKSLLVSTTAIIAVVGICAATLTFLRPWPETRTVGAVVTSGDLAPIPETQAAARGSLLSSRDDDGAVSDTETRARPFGLTPRRTVDSFSAQMDASGHELAGERLAALTPERSDANAPAHTAATPTTAPAPKFSAPMTKAEMDEALKPLVAYEISDEDVKNLKEAVRLIQKDEFAAARILITKLADPGAEKFATWYALRSGAYDATPEEIAAFRETSNLWPGRDTLDERIEEALFWRETNPRKVLAYFRERRPLSGAGKAALGGALIASGKADEGRALIREAWRVHYLTPAIESRLKDTQAETLRPEDHKARLDWLLVKNRKSDLKTIERLIPLVDKKWEKSTQAQIAAIKGDKNAGALLSKLEDDLKSEPAVLLARVQWARRNDKEELVWELLQSAPKDGKKLINPLSWWEHRESQIRYALNAGQVKTAYALAQGYGGDLPAEELSDAEFLGGWIALRFLNDAKIAHKHLLASAAAGGMPKHRARANYWLGRAELTLGNKRAATARFAEAAQYSHTFYGQLARQIAEPKTTQFALRPHARPVAADIRSFTRNPVLRALGAANKAGLDNLVPVFLVELTRTITSAPEMTLLCELSQRLTDTHQAVRYAKIAMNRGFPVEQYAYPDVLPDFKLLPSSGADLEEPLIHALTRQESEFNPTIVSSAGAVGLMQLLPSTAKEVAKAHDIKFEKKKLSSDPSYNLSLGSAFLQRLIRSYDGSYIMALAAYNAGPGRVRQWTAQFGDPRDRKVDPIDWIERIPFKETREYVLKIMESAQVYRARLNRHGDTLRLAQDLHRGRPDGGARTFMEAGMH
jgi:soluble lytic murein transglycosylase